MTTENFEGLGLTEPLLRALRGEDYNQPTPIQAQAIPQLLNGRDLLGIAQTGTGKTAAFGLPILQHLAAVGSRPASGAPRALILAPTRELAIQIEQALKTYGRHLHLSRTVVFGGVGQNPQVTALRRGVDILVATPGRLLDLMQQGHLKLNQVSHFVLDEADRMLDMGFINDVRKVVAALPKQRQTMFFSATMPNAVSGLAGDILSDPVRVAVTPQATPVERVRQSVHFVPSSEKRDLLARLLRDPAIERVIVFTRTKHRANHVAEALGRLGIGADAIHGNKSQGARQRALEAFRKGRVRVLVATDIAARGIDVDGVTHVINFELPNVPEDYVHRIGRTARAGNDGAAISLCAPDEQFFLMDIEKLTHQRIEIASGQPMANPPPPVRPGSRQGRPSNRSANRPANGPKRSANPGRNKKRNHRGGKPRRAA